MAMILAKTEIRPLGDGRWEEVECYEERMPNSFILVRTEEKVVNRFRPILPEETHRSLLDMGKRVVLAKAEPDVWVTEE